MKILIYGAGVIGSLYASLLSGAGVDVSVYARGKRLERLESQIIFCISEKLVMTWSVSCSGVKVMPSRIQRTSIYQSPPSVK